MSFDAPQRRVALSRTQILRLIFVFALGGFALARTLPDALRIREPNSVFGYVTDANGTITHVFDKSPAQAAQLKVGDRIDLHDINRFDRKPGLIGQNFSVYNPVRRITIVHEGRRASFELHGIPESWQTRIIVLLHELVALIIIGIAMTLSIVRPSAATLGFFLYSVGGEYSSTLMSTWLNFPWRMVLDITNDVLVAGASVGLLAFALNFPRELPERMRTRANIVLIALWTLCAAAFTYADVASNYFAAATNVYAQVYRSIQTIVIVATIAVFAATFLRTGGARRVRIGWIVAAFLVGIIGNGAAERLYPQFLRYWQYGALQLLPLLPSLAVAYGVARYHILGVDFVVNRAIVYAAMTAAIIGVFALGEEGLAYYFYNNTDLTYAILIAFTLVLGLFFGKVRDGMRRIVDRLMFRDRLKARERLDALAQQVPSAASRQIIEYALTNDVRHALDLRCAALFELRGEECYQLIAQVGWPETVSSLPCNDPFIEKVVKGGAEFLHDRDWQTWSMDLQNALPRFALPIMVDAKTAMIAIYGPEISGVDLDPDEVKSLERLASAAAAGLTNLLTRELSAQLEELMSLREENARLRAQIVSMQP